MRRLFWYSDISRWSMPASSKLQKLWICSSSKFEGGYLLLPARLLKKDQFCVNLYLFTPLELFYIYSPELSLLSTGWWGTSTCAYTSTYTAGRENCSSIPEIDMQYSSDTFAFLHCRDSMLQLITWHSDPLINILGPNLSVIQYLY